MSDTDAIYSALVAAQAEMPAVEPNQTNPHFKSKFVSLDHLIAKTRPVLNGHGLAIVQRPTNLDGRPALETRLVHISGQSLSSVMPLLLQREDMQGLGAAITYARRYAWAAVLGIASEEDDDGENASRPAQTNSQANPGGNGQAPVEGDPKTGRVKLARGWADWTARMDAIGVPPDDSKEWLRQACDALGIESLQEASPDVRKGVFARANEALVILSGTDWALEPNARYHVRKAFAAAFDGVEVEGPAWRINGGESDRPAAPGVYEPSAEERAAADAIPFGD